MPGSTPAKCPAPTGPLQSPTRPVLPTGTAPKPRQSSAPKASAFAPLAETQHQFSRFSPRLGKRNPRLRLYTLGRGVASRLTSIPGSPSTAEVMLCTHGFGRARHFNSWSRCVSRVGGVSIGGGFANRRSNELHADDPRKTDGQAAHHAHQAGHRYAPADRQVLDRLGRQAGKTVCPSAAGL